jgi:hypothetical protein
MAWARQPATVLRNCSTVPMVSTDCDLARAS